MSVSSFDSAISGSMENRLTEPQVMALMNCGLSEESARRMTKAQASETLRSIGERARKQRLKVKKR